MIMLEFNNLCKRYKRNTVALDNLSFKVEAGRIYGLIGPNGAGKTTCMNILAGLIRKNSGTIYVAEQEIKESDYQYKSRIGFVLSRPLYLNMLNAYEYLSFVCAMYSIDESESKQLIKELISYFELETKMYENINTYSTGMKKKISLAAAMIHKPEILVLDEPLESIEPQTSHLIKETLMSLSKKKNVTILISSHNLDVIEKLCDDIGIIHNGRIIFESPIESLEENIKLKYNKTDLKSLEEVFVQIIGGESKKQLSWLSGNIDEIQK